MGIRGKAMKELVKAIELEAIRCMEQEQIHEAIDRLAEYPPYGDPREDQRYTELVQDYVQMTLIYIRKYSQARSDGGIVLPSMDWHDRREWHE